MNFMLVLLVLLLIVSVFLYSCYANVIRKGNALDEATSGIDVQLRKRYDLIPNVLTIANKFMEHERNLITEVTKLRSLAMETEPGSAASMAANAKLDTLLGQLKVSMENYPQLKSDATMVQAMQTYNEVEEHIAAARRFYNAALADLKNAAQIFPGSLFVGMVAEKLTRAYYATDEASKAPISANDYLK